MSNVQVPAPGSPVWIENLDQVDPYPYVSLGAPGPDYSFTVKPPTGALAVADANAVGPYVTNKLITPQTGSMMLTLFGETSSQTPLAGVIAIADANAVGPSLTLGTTITPLVGSVAIADVNATGPQQQVEITPSAGAVAVADVNLVGPTIVLGTVLAPLAGPLAVADANGVGPTIVLGTVLTPTAGIVGVTGYASTQSIEITPSVGAAALAGSAPAVSQAAGAISLTPSAGSIAYTGSAPSAQLYAPPITPAAGAINLGAPCTFDSSLITFDSSSVTLDASVGGLAPLIGVEIAPAAASLGLTGYLPPQTLTLPSPISALLALADYTPNLPVVNTTFTPAATALAWTSYTPIQETFAIPGSGAIAISDVNSTGPMQAIEIVVGTGTVGLTAGIPQLQGRITLGPPNGVVALDGQAPQTLVATLITPAATSIGFTNYAPSATVAIELVASPPAALLGLAGIVPAIGTGLKIAGTALALAGNSAVVRYSPVLSPSAGALALDGSLPTQGLDVTPGAGSVGIDGVAPTAESLFATEPPAGAVDITGQAPQLVVNSILTPSTDALVFTEQQAAAYETLIPTAGALALEGQVPLITESMSPDSALLGIQAFAPVVIFSSPDVAPPATVLAFAGYPPFCEQSTPTIRERILAYVSSMLAVQTGFSFTRSRQAAASRREGVVCCLQPESDEAEMINWRAVKHRLTIQIHVIGRGAAPDTAIDRALVAITNAIRADSTLSGLCAQILDNGDPAEWTFEWADQTAVVCTQKWVAIYLCAANDLTQPVQTA